VKNIKKLAGALVLSAALTAGCANSGGSSGGGGGGGGGNTASSGPIKIGVIVPLSGPAGPNGKDVLQAIQAEVDIVNQAGGVMGRKVQVVSEDDKSTPASGVTAANDLASKGVSVVMGGWNSPVTLAIQPVLVRAGILNITTIPQAANIIGGADPEAVRLNAGNAVGGYVAGQFIVKKLNGHKVGLLLENDAYGNDAGTYVTKSLQSLGAKVVGTQKFDYTDTDFRIPLSNLASANPDVVFSADAAESSGMPALVTQYQQSGLKATHFAGLGTVSPNVLKLAGGSKVNGLYSADLYFPEAAPFNSYDANKKFVAAFQKASGGTLPDKYAALGAESVMVWAQAVKKANSLDRKAVGGAIQGQTFNDTILGTVSFTADGQMKTPIYPFQVVNGQIKVLDQVAVPDQVWSGR
jgi:branched-chain amino acid transport system substrate-binding protein